MIPPHVSVTPLPNHPLWSRAAADGKMLSFNLEVTARCNNDCRHCYVNLPAGDADAMRAEMTLEAIGRVADAAIDMGALWCLITGGEPLLRKDFQDIYLMLKRKRLLISVFTNATLVTEDLVRLFERYPPRDIEVSVYGATRETYERVTRRKGSFAAFYRGLGLLLDSDLTVGLKAVAMRSNVHEMPLIARFCRERSRRPYRFDPVLHLRTDCDPARNEEIRAERLSPEEIVALERADTVRQGELEDRCEQLIFPGDAAGGGGRVFRCGAGVNKFAVSYDGLLKLCQSACAPDLVADSRDRNTGIPAALAGLSVRAASLRSSRPEFTGRCDICRIRNLCLSCPGHAWLETGAMDLPGEYFCRAAHARAESLRKAAGEGNRGVL
jgi:radical SAM protein with 4Fe4S-binding SPASM domain